MPSTPTTESDRDRFRGPVIALDGPSGSGKSSTARGVASELGLAFLDTGAMYRAATWVVDAEGLLADDADDAAIAERVGRIEWSLTPRPEAFTVAVDGTDVSEAIRRTEISQLVSRVARIPAVREELIGRQRAVIAEAPDGIVVEGRDITTVVAPEADVRVLLVADPQARVARRSAEVAGSGAEVSAESVSDSVLRRDRDDAAVTAFETAADGVTTIDSTHLTLPEVIAAVIDLVPPPFRPPAP